MKTNLNSNYCLAVWALMTVLSFVGCSADSDVVNEVVAPSLRPSFTVTLKAINAEGEDVTTKGDVSVASLYVFDENNDFVKEISLDKSTLLQRRAVQIDCPDAKQITVVAWGGLSADNVDVTPMSRANIISDLQVRLKQSNGVAAPASDLFYGQIVLTPTTTKASGQELRIARKVSSISLTTKGLLGDHSAASAATYLYKVKKTKSAFSANGELTGADIEYVFSASFDKNGNLVAPTTPILPATDITVELFKDGKMLFSQKIDQNGENLSVKAGKQLTIVFDGISRNFAEIVVAPWNTVVQYVDAN
ncbi:MAG: FimB/Mfa2 family fimbrial subunit [Tannerellaceae bacterium]